MHRKRDACIKRLILMVMVCACGLGLWSSVNVVKAENPLVQTMYTADPAPLVVGDTIYVYTTRDERRESGTDEWSLMNEWRCFSSKDMVNWTDHGQIAHAQTYDGKDNWRAWAPQCVMRPVWEDGEWKDKYFFFGCFNGTKIDVAVADNPWGPFEDATPGKYLIDGGWGGGNIDPTVLIDDHGHPEDKANYDAYLYWGNPYFRYCKLTDDMLDVDPDTDGDGVISEEENTLDARFSREDNKILGEVRAGLHSIATNGEEGIKSFGTPSLKPETTQKYPTEAEGAELPRSAFEEGPWVIKHDDGKEGTDDYFLVFVGGRIPGETIEYSTAPTPIGPWTYQGMLMERENGFSCNHPGVASFKGKNYLFYLNEMLVGGTGSDRSICVKEFEYDENNKIKKETAEGKTPLFEMGFEKGAKKGYSYFSVDPVGTLNPYEMNQAETICWASNLEGPEGGVNGTQRGVKTKAKFEFDGIDPITGKVAFWQSAFFNGVVVCDINNDDYIKVREADFGEEGAKSFTVNAACGDELAGGDIEVWLDYEEDDQRQIGTVAIENTGGDNIYQDFTIELEEKVTGVHDLYFIFKGEEEVSLFQLDTWKFTEHEKPVIINPTPIPTETPVIQPTPGTTYNNNTVSQRVETPAWVKSVQCALKAVQLTWDTVPNAKEYELYRATSKNGTYSKIAVAKASSYQDKKVKQNKTYYYKVRAVGASEVRGSFSKTEIQTVFERPVIKSLKRVKKKLVVKIKKLRKNQYAEILVSTKKNKKYIKAAVLKKAGGKIVVSKKEKKLYVKVRYYSNLGGIKKYSMYSKVRVVKN